MSEIHPKIGNRVWYDRAFFICVSGPHEVATAAANRKMKVMTWRSTCKTCGVEFDVNYNMSWPIGQTGPTRNCPTHKRRHGQHGGAGAETESAEINSFAAPSPPPRNPLREMSIAELDALAEAELKAPASPPTASTGLKPDEIEFCVKMLCAAMRAHNIPRSIPTLIEQVALYAADTQNTYWRQLNALLGSSVERYAEIIGHMIQRKFVDLVDGDKTQMDPAHREYLATVLTDEGHEHAEAYSRRVFKPDEKTATLDPVAFASSAPAASGPVPMHMRPEFAAGNIVQTTVASATAASAFKAALRALSENDFRAVEPPRNGELPRDEQTMNWCVWDEVLFARLGY